MANQGDDERQAESRRILERVDREGDIGHSHTAAAAQKAREHFAAADADQADWTEVWGTRIARGLAVVAALAVIVWLVGYLSR